MLQTGLLRDNATEKADDSLDIKALLRMVLKHKWMLLSVVLLCVAAAVVKSLDQHPAVPGHGDAADRSAPAHRRLQGLGLRAGVRGLHGPAHADRCRAAGRWPSV